MLLLRTHSVVVLLHTCTTVHSRLGEITKGEGWKEGETRKFIELYVLVRREVGWNKTNNNPTHSQHRFFDILCWQIFPFFHLRKATIVYSNHVP